MASVAHDLKQGDVLKTGKQVEVAPAKPAGARMDSNLVADRAAGHIEIDMHRTKPPPVSDKGSNHSGSQHDDDDASDTSSNSSKGSVDSTGSSEKVVGGPQHDPVLAANVLHQGVPNPAAIFTQNFAVDPKADMVTRPEVEQWVTDMAGSDPDFKKTLMAMYRVTKKSSDGSKKKSEGKTRE